MLTLSRFCYLLLALLCWSLSSAPSARGQSSLEIIEAIYGAGAFQMNVTPKVRALVRNNALDVAADPAVLGGDPAPGQGKRLRIRYRFGGGELEASAADFEHIQIPVSPVTNLPGASLPSNLPPAQPAQPLPKDGNWAAGAIPGAAQPAPASPGGFSIGDLFGDSQLRIVSARYGVDNRFNDVRERLQGMVRNSALSVKIDNVAMGGDPAAAKAKVLEVTYEYKGATYQTIAKEGATLNLPEAGSKPTIAAQVSAGLRITAARYGGDNRFNDVRERLQAMVRDNALSVKVDNAAMGGDPAVGKDKVVEVEYEMAGKVYRTSAREGRTLNLPDSNAQVVSTSAPTAPPPAANVPSTRGADTGASRTAGGRNSVASPVASSGAVAPLGTAGGLRIFYARYGVDGKEIDVRERLRPLLQNDALRATVNTSTMGSDPAPGAAKAVTILYEFKGRTFEKIARDGEAIQLP